MIQLLRLLTEAHTESRICGFRRPTPKAAHTKHGLLTQRTSTQRVLRVRVLRKPSLGSSSFLSLVVMPVATSSDALVTSSFYASRKENPQWAARTCGKSLLHPCRPWRVHGAIGQVVLGILLKMERTCMFGVSLCSRALGFLGSESPPFGLCTVC